MASFYQVALFISIVFSSIQSSVAQSPAVVEATATTRSVSSQATVAPSCAKKCIQSATGVQSCAPGNQTCLCSYSTQIQEVIYTCLDTSTCTPEEKVTAFDYYPAYCRSLNLAIETDLPTAIATAGGATPSAASIETANLVGDSQPQATQSEAMNGNNTPQGLQLPAILGITLAVVALVVGVMASILWSYLQRRRIVRRPRMDLGGELAESNARPTRSKSVNSDFMVQPSPVEKDVMGGSLSRSSTLIPPPPVAKDIKRSSDEKRNSARGKALNLLVGNHNGSKRSPPPSRSSSKQSSLVESPSDPSRRSEEVEVRLSKI